MLNNIVADLPTPPSIAVLFGIFFRIGLFSFGGGLSGWVYREIVILRGWLDEDEFMSGLAVSQVLPGANIINLSVYVGQKLRGAPGACATFFGLICAPFFAVIGIASIYSTLRQLSFAEAAMDGIAAAAIGMILIVAGRGIRRAAPRPEALVALFVTFVAVGLLHYSLLLVVAIVAPLSVLAAWYRGAPNGERREG
jgi:chromate transporter